MKDLACPEEAGSGASTIELVPEDEWDAAVGEEGRLQPHWEAASWFGLLLSLQRPVVLHFGPIGLPSRGATEEVVEPCLCEAQESLGRVNPRAIGGTSKCRGCKRSKPCPVSVTKSVCSMDAVNASRMMDGMWV